MYRNKKNPSVFRVLHCLEFRASTDGLGMYPCPLGKGGAMYKAFLTLFPSSKVEITVALLTGRPREQRGAVQKSPSSVSHCSGSLPPRCCGG